MRRAAAVGVLAGFLLGGCSLFGLYDGACCAFAPPGPPLENAGVPLVIYDTHGARIGTVLPSATGATLYRSNGARAGTVR